MSKAEKLAARLLRTPTAKDISWDELCTFLSQKGFTQQPSGKGFRFVHQEHPEREIYLHRPHRNPPTVLVCYLKEVMQSLREWGLV